MHALARDVAAQADHIRTLLRSYPALCEHLCALAQLDSLWLAGRRHCLNQCMPWLAMLPLRRITYALCFAHALLRVSTCVLWLSWMVFGWLVDGIA